MSRKTFQSCLLAFLLIPASFSVKAGPEAGGTANATGSNSPEITDIYLLGMEKEKPVDDKISQQDYDEHRRTAGLNDTLVLKVKNLNELLKNPSCDKPPCSPKSVSLYFHGKKIADIDLKKGLLGKDNDTVEFDLTYGSKRTDIENLDSTIKSNWAKLLGSPNLNKEFWKRKVEVAVGIDNEKPIKFKDSILLRRIDYAKFWISIGVAIFLLSLLLFIKDSRKDMREALSDIGPMPNMGGSKPWSLARCQMAFWFVMVAVSFLSIWVVTGALDTITGSVLALIGIGSGSALGSALIDVAGDNQVKIDKLQQRKNELEGVVADLENGIGDKEIMDLQKMIVDLTNQVKAAASTDTKAKLRIKLDGKVKEEEFKLKEKLGYARTLLQYTENKIGHQSNGFWNDILNDNESAAFHRIQMFVWTLILGGIFVYSVWKSLSMPEFSETLLALQGISAGTYLGFKLPEKSS